MEKVYLCEYVKAETYALQNEINELQDLNCELMVDVGHYNQDDEECMHYAKIIANVNAELRRNQEAVKELKETLLFQRNMVDALQLENWKLGQDG